MTAMLDILADHWGEIYLATEWAIRIAMVIAVPFRRSPEAARSWLLLVFFLPIPALILYLLIGRPEFPRWRQQRFAGMPRLPQADEAIAQGISQHPPTIAERRQALSILVSNLGKMPASGGNRIEIMADYAGVIDSICADIDGARHHVHILVYIFADDATGMRVIEALGRAVARGVTCRVVIDSFGSHAWAARVIAALKDRGVHAVQALPVRLLRRRPARADLRNHRKLVIIDGHVGYVGSQNIVNADFRPGILNEELVARAQGPIVATVQSLFLTDWYLETQEVPPAEALFPPLPGAGGATVQLLPSGPDYPVAGTERLAIALLYAARERVVLTTPYFIPDEGLLEALQSAVLRGVEVRLVVSEVQDQWLVAHAQRSFYAELLRSGVRIFLYRNRLLHAKHVVVDRDIASVGSSNVDIRSFTLNAEANLILYGEGAVAPMEPVLDRYFSHSVELDAKSWSSRPPHKKIVENIARLISPLL